jgi:hypothetical protein
MRLRGAFGDGDGVFLAERAPSSSARANLRIQNFPTGSHS